jgi:hypothetical protein
MMLFRPGCRRDYETGVNENHMWLHSHNKLKRSRPELDDETRSDIDIGTEDSYTPESEIDEEDTEDEEFITPYNESEDDDGNKVEDININTHPTLLNAESDTSIDHKSLSKKRFRYGKKKAAKLHKKEMMVKADRKLEELKEKYPNGRPVTEVAKPAFKVKNVRFNRRGRVRYAISKDKSNPLLDIHLKYGHLSEDA